MTAPAERPGWLPRAADDLFGEGATAEHAYGLLTVDVPAGTWIAALTTARDELGCTFFDWLSAVDEPGTGFRVCAHLVALPTADRAGTHRLVIRTTVPHEAAALPTATGVYAGAAWHERETHEMFGVDFPGHPHLVPLLLPDTFEGHPLRKDFVLAARVTKAWPGAKEPGESGHGGPKRRQMLPPGVPDPNEWGPLKGQLPPAPARERTRRTATKDSPRRARSASAGSASQRSQRGAAAAPAEPEVSETPEAPATPEASEMPVAPEVPVTPVTPEASTASKGTSSPEPPPSGRSATGPSSSGPEPTPPERSATPRGKASGAQVPRSSDAPWHHTPEVPLGDAGTEADARADTEAETRADTAAGTGAGTDADPGAATDADVDVDVDASAATDAGTNTDSDVETDADTGPDAGAETRGENRRDED